MISFCERWSWRCRTPDSSPDSSTKDAEDDASDADADTDDNLVGCERSGGSDKGRDGDEDEDGGRKRSKPRERGRGDTGVASLLVALAKADPTGETIKSMMRWVCEGLMPEQVHAAIHFNRLVYSYFFLCALGVGCLLVLGVGVFLAVMVPEEFAMAPILCGGTLAPRHKRQKQSMVSVPQRLFRYMVGVCPTCVWRWTAPCATSCLVNMLCALASSVLRDRWGKLLGALLVHSSTEMRWERESQVVNTSSKDACTQSTTRLP